LLGRPVGKGTDSAIAPEGGERVDRPLTLASYREEELPAPERTVRGQAPALSGPSLAPAPPAAGFAAPTNEAYNCGVVTRRPPDDGHPGLDGCKNWLGAIGCGEGCARPLFQSDRCFPEFISPVTNPFLFEDPRSLTELRPIFIHQASPINNPIYQGGDIEFAGLQGRLALTDYLSLVVNKAGYVWNEPHNHVNGFEPHAGLSEVWLGPKLTFLRVESTGTLAAAGYTFQLPVGPAKVFQDTGNLSMTPYLSLGQTVWKTTYGTFNALNTAGYTFDVDNTRTDYAFDSFHLDFDVGNLRVIYPLFEASWFHYTSNGNGRALNFEGRDLFNFGANDVKGHDTVTLAGGARYRFNDCLWAGVAGEAPVGGHHDLIDWRITADVIFRY
jgi:hypothetical protein